jgi:hypothetical protein
MALSRRSIERGVSRLYIVAAAAWLLWLLLWLPMETMEANTRSALALKLPLDDRSWGQKWWAIIVTDGFARDPVFMTFFVLGVPMLGYLLLIGAIRVCYWIAAGFTDGK